MSDHQPRLFTHDEWEALTDAERQWWREQRRRDVDAAREERQRLNDALTVERFSRGSGDGHAR